MLSFRNGVMKFLTFFFKRKVCYSAIDVGTLHCIYKIFQARFRASPERGRYFENFNQVILE